MRRFGKGRRPHPKSQLKKQRDPIYQPSDRNGSIKINEAITIKLGTVATSPLRFGWPVAVPWWTGWVISATQISRCSIHRHLRCLKRTLNHNGFGFFSSPFLSLYHSLSLSLSLKKHPGKMNRSNQSQDVTHRPPFAMWSARTISPLTGDSYRYHIRKTFCFILTWLGESDKNGNGCECVLWCRTDPMAVA